MLLVLSSFSMNRMITKSIDFRSDFSNRQASKPEGQKYIYCLKVACVKFDRVYISSASPLAELFITDQMLFVFLCVCLDINQRGTNRNRCTQRLVILLEQTY